MLITLQEYAERHGITFGTLRTAMSNKKWFADVKIKNRWYVDENKPWYAKHHIIHKKINGKAASYSRVYNIWRCMKQRCYNTKNSHYYLYGGRGITVCEEWKNSSEAFIEWAYSHGYADDLEIDRIDNDKGYSPENCQWITKKDNIKKSANPYTYDTNGILKKRRLYKEFKSWGIGSPESRGIYYPKFSWEE